MNTNEEMLSKYRKLYSTNTNVKNVIEALSAIDNQDDLNAIAKAWKMQMNYIADMRKATVKVGDTITWTNKGFIRKSIVQKVNRTTVDVIDAGATPFGRTVTRVPLSMVDA